MFQLFSEASTWRGVILLFTALGINISPDQATSITSLGLAIAGALGAFLPDKLK